jgi:YVTN family beta-propeller protein
MTPLVPQNYRRKLLPVDLALNGLVPFAMLFAFVFAITLHSAPPRAAQAPSPALLILEKDDSMLAVADPVTFKIVGRVAAGADPHEVAASSDGKTAYITNYGAFGTPLHTLSVVDLVTLQARPAVELGALLAPHGIENVGGKIYFTAEGSKALGRYDPATDKVDWILGVGENRTHMLVVAPDANRIFASDVNSDAISIFDRDKNADASGWRQTRVAVGKGPEGFDVSPDGKELWAANSHDGTISIIDLTSRAVVATLDVKTKFANRLKFSPDGALVLISDLGTGDLVVLDAHARKEIKRLKVGSGVAGILLDLDGSRAFVAASRDNFIAVIDLKTLAIVGKIPTGRGVDGLAWAVRK